MLSVSSFEVPRRLAFRDASGGAHLHAGCRALLNDEARAIDGSPGDADARRQFRQYRPTPDL